MVTAFEQGVIGTSLMIRSDKRGLFYERRSANRWYKAIKGSTELTHGSVCSDVRKLQSMDVLKLQSTKADWNTKCPFHNLTYIYIQ